MNHSILRLSCLVGAAVLAAACDPEPESTTPELRQVVFEADEVAAALAQDPETTFFVDLRQPARYTFEQPDAPIDLAPFVVQGPTMESPVPLADVLDHPDVTDGGVDLSGEAWSIQAPLPEFRTTALRDDPGNGAASVRCTEICVGGPACIWVCEIY